ncbi:hypothetical protein QYE76_064628 [Lolium multiflorum]|uniref:Uncharacterized protein n=1 Tax=Lolium multiflorum TaxID=4521 RepID=A0AAD8S814_LOLMU|nr:hypothetical protein QYE76_064628 [Lolium multiflorum]
MAAIVIHLGEPSFPASSTRLVCRDSTSTHSVLAGSSDDLAEKTSGPARPVIIVLATSAFGGSYSDPTVLVAMDDQYMEDIAFGARFDETDDEEKNENDDSLVLADYEGEDLPTIEWNREDPQLAKGTVFQTMMDCRNAITTYHILTKNNYEVIKSEPDQAGAANAEENEAAIQLEEIEAVQHEEIEAAST